jgi:hypothetical protein
LSEREREYCSQQSSFSTAAFATLRVFHRGKHFFSTRNYMIDKLQWVWPDMPSSNCCWKGSSPQDGRVTQTHTHTHTHTHIHSPLSPGLEVGVQVKKNRAQAYGHKTRRTRTGKKKKFLCTNRKERVRDRSKERERDE